MLLLHFRLNKVDKKEGFLINSNRIWVKKSMSLFPPPWVFKKKLLFELNLQIFVVTKAISNNFVLEFYHGDNTGNFTDCFF